MTQTTELVEIRPGHQIRHRGIRGSNRTITIDRAWAVYLDDGTLPVRPENLVGHLAYEMCTRETKKQGKRYVNRRWTSPGWRYKRIDSHTWFEATTKRAALEALTTEVR
jgi:hypothetical protein